MKDNNGYVFISYSSQNQQVADSFRQLLIEEKIACWMAPYDIPAGSRYAYVINDALENCTCLVLLLTNASQSSQFVEREIERAITYKKPIIPLQMEDLELNSGFKFYIGSSQIIAVPEIRRDASAVNQAISGIRNFLSPVSDSHQVIEHTHRNMQKYSCRVTIWSPVNVDVFLNDKRRPVLKVDHNSGFDYSSNTITAGEEFTLIFSARGFEKEILFDMPSDGKLEYHLKSILTADEIASSYDREEAIRQIKTEPTGYSFEQLGVVGEAEDIGLLKKILTSLSAGMDNTDQHRNYLIARCSVALGKLCIKYSSFENVAAISEIYDKYPAKRQYGSYFENILKSLTSSIDEKFRLENRELLAAAEAGDAEAQYKIAGLYSDKTSVYKNWNKAFSYYLQAAEGGYIDAMMKVAVLYYVGLGCGGKDTAKEQYWYRKAMEAGSDMAIYCLADALDQGYLDHGRVGKTDEEATEAVSLYRMASEKGIAKASKALAFKYWREHDEVEERHWFRIGAEQGDAECQLHTAMYLYHCDTDEQNLSDKEDAFRWYMKAADQNNTKAQYGAARCLFYGAGTDKDEEAAFGLILQAAESGNVPAQEVLSIMYGRGLGTQQDSQKSEYWYRKANKLERPEDYKKKFFDHLEMLTESHPVFDENYW